MLFTQINTLQIQKKENIFNLIVQYLEKYSSIVQQLHTGAGLKWAGRKSYWLEKEKEVGDGRAEGSSAIEMEDKLQFYPRPTLIEHIFASLKVHSLKIHI